MKEYQNLFHTKWDCKYHVIFIPKRRENNDIWSDPKTSCFGEILRELAVQKECQIVGDWFGGYTVQDIVLAGGWPVFRENLA